MQLLPLSQTLDSQSIHLILLTLADGFRLRLAFWSWFLSETTQIFFDNANLNYVSLLYLFLYLKAVTCTQMSKSPTQAFALMIHLLYTLFLQLKPVDYFCHLIVNFLNSPSVWHTLQACDYTPIYLLSFSFLLARHADYLVWNEWNRLSYLH